MAKGENIRKNISSSPSFDLVMEIVIKVEYFLKLELIINIRKGILQINLCQ